VATENGPVFLVRLGVQHRADGLVFIGVIVGKPCPLEQEGADCVWVSEREGGGGALAEIVVNVSGIVAHYVC
jgi:hypothetical protein